MVLAQSNTLEEGDKKIAIEKRGKERERYIEERKI